jgi:hypothetical protein
MKNIQSTKTAKMNEYIKSTPKKTVRVYIDGYLPSRLSPEQMKKLAPYYRKSMENIEVFSHEGLFRIENRNNIFKIKVTDLPVVKKTDAESFGSLTLLVDPSIYEKEPVLSQLPYDHTVYHTTSLYYSCIVQAKEPKLMLIVDGIYTDPSKFTATNVYFLATEDIDHLLIKEELVELLTALF